MNEIELVASALTSLKAATEIAQLLRRGNHPLEKAEGKLKLAELTEALADLKIAVSDFQERLREKDARITELQHSLEITGAVKKHGDAIYRLQCSPGDPEGDAYCVRCWQEDHRLRVLVHDPANFRARKCSVCTASYESRSVSHIPLANPAG